MPAVICVVGHTGALTELSKCIFLSEKGSGPVDMSFKEMRRRTWGRAPKRSACLRAT